MRCHVITSKYKTEVHTFSVENHSDFYKKYKTFQNELAKNEVNKGQAPTENNTIMLTLEMEKSNYKTQTIEKYYKYK